MPPIEHYAQRKTAREAAAAARERTHIYLGNAKVGIFIAVVIYTAYALTSNPSAIVYSIALVAFVSLSIWHEFVMSALTRARAAVQHYEDGIARIEDRWMRDEPSGERFRDRDHPYADDLDIFGPRSLFQLLSCCRTPMGEQRLATWLLHVVTVEEIQQRQSRVATLKDRVGLRERIAVVNAGRRQSINAAKLIVWAETRRQMPAIRPLVVSMAVAFAVALGVYMNGGRGIYVAIVAAINVALLGFLGKRGNDVVENLAASTESAALDLLSNVIREIEREPFDETRFVTGLKGDAASRGIARLARISDWADSRHNAFLRLSEIPFLFTLQLAYAAESWRAEYGRHLHEWIDAVAETEALLSLAGYAYEHPDDPLPDLIHGAPLVDAIDATHPLIPSATAVRNSVKLGGAGPASPKSQAPGPRILIVSGSNMSGKSTLMRTVGINAVLAFAGAPVRAARLRLTPLQIGTCLRHTDSLQERRSGFYTEALRLRAIADLLDGPRPVLFLFDELLSGTNSKDRRTASEGVIRTMLSKNAIGMVTTHDLALTEIAELSKGDVKNVHLQDTVVDGKMVFDYKLRAGVITHSNALELMRIIGLDV